MFYDLGLYYPGGRDDFKSMITDHYYVIRYKTNDCGNARIPVHKMDDFTNTHEDGLGKKLSTIQFIIKNIDENKFHH